MNALSTSLRIAAVAAVGFFSLASSTPSSEPRYNGGQDPYEQQQHQDMYSNLPQGVWSCYALRSQQTEGSICFGSRDRCDREREAASHDGAQTSECRPLAPVSCFQLGGGTGPANEVCAATPKDCDMWRAIDTDRSGASGNNPACEWRHAVARQGQQSPGRPQGPQGPQGPGGSQGNPMQPGYPQPQQQPPAPGQQGDPYQR
jgi:hypothetical protein